MKKELIGLVVFFLSEMVIAQGVPYADEPNGSEKRINFSWHGVSFCNDENKVVEFSFNWLFGRDSTVKGLQANLLFGEVEEDLTGVQNSLITSLVARRATGFQSSAFYNEAQITTGLALAPFGVNRSMEMTRGIQAALLGNYSGGDISIAQIGGFNQAKGSVGWLQMGVFSFSDAIEALQIDLLLSVARDTTNGFQIGGVNYTPYLAGVQIGGGNWTIQSTGAQIGLINYSKSFTGAQIGLINIAQNGTGGQLGLINYAKVLNGVSLGILDIQLNGENHLEYTIETSSSLSTTALYHRIEARVGGNFLYKSIHAGFRTGDNAADQNMPLYSGGVSLGLRLPFFKTYAACRIDAGMEIANWTQTIVLDPNDQLSNHLLPECRAMIEINPIKPFGIVFGSRIIFYGDEWNSSAKPSTSFELIRSPDWSLWTSTRFFMGIKI